MRNENKLMKKEGRNMAKADMQKLKTGGISSSLKAHAAAPASKAHAMAKGGGVEMKGKTKGKKVGMKKGSSCK